MSVASEFRPDTQNVGSRADTQNVGEKRGQGIALSSETTSPRRERPRNEIFDALALVCGYELDKIPKMEGQRIAVAAADLKRIGATVDEIGRRARLYRRHPTFSGCALTPTALVANWSALAPKSPLTAAVGLHGKEPWNDHSEPGLSREQLAEQAREYAAQLGASTAEEPSAKTNHEPAPATETSPDSTPPTERSSP